MATDTHKSLERNDSRFMWTILAIIIAAILAYAVYAMYYGTDNYSGVRPDGTTVTGTTTTPTTNP